MLRFVVFVLKNLGRNKLRTTLTGMAVVVLVAIYTIASTVTDKVNEAVEAHSSEVRLILREKWTIPSRLPIRYVPELASLDAAYSLARSWPVLAKDCRCPLVSWLTGFAKRITDNTSACSRAGSEYISSEGL